MTQTDQPFQAIPTFPADLHQADGVHCSVDALLLAAFARGQGLRVVDIGAGCGVVGLGLLLRQVASSVLALERDVEQAACARRNAELWGVEHVLRVETADILAGLAHERLPFVACAANSQELADLVVCNPPWRLLGSQRPPQCVRRRLALFGTPETVSQFVRAGAARLRRKGILALVIGAERLHHLLFAVHEAGLCPSRLRCVHPRPGRDAVFALLESRSGVHARLHVEPPLFLHGLQGQEYSAEAQAFCPWLETGAHTPRQNGIFKGLDDVCCTDCHTLQPCQHASPRLYPQAE